MTHHSTTGHTTQTTSHAIEQAEQYTHDGQQWEHIDTATADTTHDATGQQYAGQPDSVNLDKLPPELVALIRRQASRHYINMERARLTPQDRATLDQIRKRLKGVKL